MLTITIPGGEFWDEGKEEFSTTKETVLSLEHSLVSLSKWESKWCIPFLSKTEKTTEQTLDYVVCMTITQNVDPNVYSRLSDVNLNTINDYIGLPMTATRISKQNSGGNREIITSELIYYWMIALQIPFECQKWHLNRLFTLISVCNIKNQSPKKMKAREILQRNAELNAQRRAAMGSKG